MPNPAVSVRRTSGCAHHRRCPHERKSQPSSSCFNCARLVLYRFSLCASSKKKPSSSCLFCVRFVLCHFSRRPSSKSDCGCSNPVVKCLHVPILRTKTKLSCFQGILVERCCHAPVAVIHCCHALSESCVTMLMTENDTLRVDTRPAQLASAML